MLFALFVRDRCGGLLPCGNWRRKSTAFHREEVTTSANFDSIRMTFPRRPTNCPKTIYRAQLLVSHISAFSIRVYIAGTDLSPTLC